MSFTVHPVLSTTIDRQGTQKVYVRVIYDRKKVDFPTDVRITPDQMENQKIVKHKQKTLYNNVIAQTKHRIEGALIKLEGRNVSKEELKKVVYGEVHGAAESSAPSFTDFIYDQCDKHEGRWAAGSIRLGKGIAKKIEIYQKDVKLDQITADWLRAFEKHLRDRGISHNTASVTMKWVKGFLKKAAEAEIVDDKNFRRYMVPVERRKTPTYLDETEVANFYKAVQSFQMGAHKVAGYYFLLACTTGFRISDAKKFDYNEMVQGDVITLRAKKNKSIVSIPLHPMLREIVEWVRVNPFSISEGIGNEYLKEICKICGINKSVSFHVGRHTFAMMLMDRRFSLDTVAELLGDSMQVARVYARISNTRIRDEFKEKFENAFNYEAAGITP